MLTATFAGLAFDKNTCLTWFFREKCSMRGAEAVFGANVDRSSCSCVEGNPCVDPALCHDWKNRFTIAMKARWAKGLRVEY